MRGDVQIAMLQIELVRQMVETASSRVLLKECLEERAQSMVPREALSRAHAGDNRILHGRLEAAGPAGVARRRGAAWSGGWRWWWLRQN